MKGYEPKPGTVRPVAAALICASLDPRIMAAKVKLAAIQNTLKEKPTNENIAREEGQRILWAVLQDIRRELLGSNLPQ